MTLNINEAWNALRYTDGASAGRGRPAFIWIHHWGVDGQTHDGILNWFCNNNDVQTSAHYVASAGRVNCIVSTTDVAWHAGDWGVNLRSIGIECRPEATEADYQTIAELVKYLRDMYGDLPLRPHNIQRQGTDGGYGSAWTDCPGRYDLGKIDRMARGIKTQGSKPIPIPTPTPTNAKKGFLMALSDKEQDDLYAKVKELHRDYIQGVPGRNKDGDSFFVLRSILAAVKGKPIDEVARRKNVTGK
jgi:hypothetical protein